jgi:hypothetical protein
VVKGRKLFRLTFSRSLAEHLTGYLPGSEVRRVSFRLGRRLGPGERSPSGLYALVSARKGRVLRLSLIEGVAQELVDPSRYLAECWLTSGCVL